MRTIVVLALAVAMTTLANAASVDPAEAWRPLYSFVGTWKGTRTAGDGTHKITRVYATAALNRHLEITEMDGHRSRASVLGVVSFDPQRQGLVLRQFDPSGAVADLTIDPAATPTGPVVFTSLASDAARTRITYERTGPKAFVERVERASGDTFAVVSETRFVRKD